MAVSNPTRQRSAGATTERKPKPGGRSASMVGLWFALPFLIAYGFFLIWPILAGLKMSFYSSSLTGASGKFVGFANYAEVFKDTNVWRSLWHTVLFTLLTTPPLVIVGLIMALLANQGLPANWLWRLSFFAPWVLPSAAISLIWVWIFQPGFGLLNGLLDKVGITGPAWLTNPKVAMIAVAIATVWWTVGFNFLLYLSALQAIPQTVYEAAALDGASPWQQLSRITIPLLKRTTSLIIVLQLLASLKIFDQIYIMLAGGPNYSTRPILEYVYDQGFTNYRVGFASAISYFFFALILILALAQVKLFPSETEKRV